jgi:prolyl oligopeptidase
MSLTYPPARRADLVDVLHGVPVADPYRWLEDAGSPETVAWVAAQNALTRSVVDGPVRDALVDRLTALYDYPRTSVPAKRGARHFFTHNPGLLDQPVLYVLDAPDRQPRVLFDPNALDRDHPVALTALEPNDAGTLVAYGLSASGSDRQDILVRDVATGVDLADRLAWVKFASIAWVADGSGFYYTRFPEPGSVPPGDENYFNRVCYHVLGEPQERDALVHQAPDERETVFGVAVSDDDRWVVITAFQGSSDKSEVYLIDRASAGLGPSPLFRGFGASYAFVGDAAGRLFFQTDEGAPRGRIIAVDPASPGMPPAEVVAEGDDKLSLATIVHGLLVTSYLHHASDEVRLYDLSGTSRGRIPLPTIGSLTGLSGRPGDDALFLGFWSFTYPPVSFRYDWTSAALVRWDPFAAARDSASIDPECYTTSQVWYPSKDGTRVSMFLVHRKDLPKDGNRPVVLTGYGGFNINLTPSFDPANFVLLEAGGIYAVANLRGGGEYGEAWHQAGMFERKQNVFDDFIAAAEWLAASGYTRPEKIAIEGGSNGGLLTAAITVQRPDLVGAVVCRVPVADMLRYHLFTVGRFWISEYGSADDPDQFAYLLKYSPYHNVVDRTAYPAILITTADTDDRVFPGMAKKFAARLQAAGAPLAVIRVETKAGHGAGKPVSKMIEEDADIYAFLFRALDVEP